ncbi:hypothetical protein OXV64_13740 [Bacteroides fragilis]|nr:hypothetical protein [Bacteroides fragilis]
MKKESHTRDYPIYYLKSRLLQKADGNALLPYEACVPSAYHLYYQP